MKKSYKLMQAPILSYRKLVDSFIDKFLQEKIGTGCFM